MSSSTAPPRTALAPTVAAEGNLHWKFVVSNIISGKTYKTYSNYGVEG